MPLGSASIGQVHRAQLRATGEWVAVKVQFDDAEKLFRGDISNMRAFCKIAQPEQVIIFDEIERQFMTEFDYRCEARNLAEVRDNLHQAGFDRVVAVPRPFPEYSTRKLLVMELFDGVKVLTAVKSMFAKLAKISGKSLEELEREFKRNVTATASASNAGLPPPPPPPLFLPPAWQMRWLLRLTAWAAHARRWAVICYNNLLGQWVGRMFPVPDSSQIDADDIPLIDIPQLVRTLIHVHAHEILVNGVFNGDPHPGNVLYMRDGRIGLIDYGQTKRLTDEQRLIVARIFLALAQRDGDLVVQLAQTTGSKWQHGDPYVIEKTATAFLDRDGRDVTEGMNLQSFFEMLNRRDPIIKNADYFVMVWSC